MTAAPTRKRLPNSRGSEIFSFESMGTRFRACVGYYDDGRIGELFVDSYKSGSSVSSLVRDIGIVFSFAVQHGADPRAMAKALSRDSNGHPLGPLAVALDQLAQQGAAK